MRIIFIHLKIELDWEIGAFVFREDLENFLEKRGFAALARGEEHDVSSLFNAVNVISKFLASRNDIVIFGIDGTLRSKFSHCFSPAFWRMAFSLKPSRKKSCNSQAVYRFTAAIRISD